jgi:tryptophan 2,3-dioxygenase
VCAALGRFGRDGGSRRDLAFAGVLGSNAGMKPYPAVNYTEYLKINELLELQKRRSVEFGVPAHDETLFIITHQAYELWFKQILTELDSVLEIFGSSKLDESSMGTAVARLHRICEIQKLLIQQINVMETMTPLDFLDFRDMLYPASGFQSTQNRMIENKLGLKAETRLTYNSQPYHAPVSEPDRKQMLAAENAPSLFDLVDAWLSRTPFLRTDDFDFWAEYRKTVDATFDADRETVRSHPGLKSEEKTRNLTEIDSAHEMFRSLFDAAKYEELRASGAFRMSYQALHAALLIQLYRDQPVFNLPFQLITALQDIDELMTTWRYRHSLMAHRMLGRKIGTGGSSGAQYLKMATDKHRIFSDFFNLATFLIPRSRRPALPAKVREKLGFHYSAGG